MYKAISLFCGAGGLDLGFHNAGIETIWANDFNHDACETYRLWSTAEVVEGDIGKVDFDNLPDVDVILGGFPCQGFSLAGPRKIDDSRNSLYRYFVKFYCLGNFQEAIFTYLNLHFSRSLVTVWTHD